MDSSSVYQSGCAKDEQMVSRKQDDKIFSPQVRRGKRNDRIHDLTLSIGMLQVLDVTTKSAADMEFEEEGKW